MFLQYQRFKNRTADFNQINLIVHPAMKSGWIDELPE